MILQEIAQDTRIRVEEAKKTKSLMQVQAQAEAMDAKTGFPFEKMLREDGIHFICEVKKASPSKGMIAKEFPYIQIAKDYETAGAGAVSVLTEPHFFQGSNQYLQEIKQSIGIPVLRKDFTIDEYQIYEAKTLGADVVLLIVALLSEEQLQSMMAVCEKLGLSALVEAHDEEEMQQALRAGARIIGVNNRNLKDFTVDINNSLRLRKLAPAQVLFIAESGMKTAEDIQKLYENGVNGVLIGETLMRSDNKKAMMEELTRLIP